MVGGCDYPPQVGAGDGAAQSDVGVRGEAFLGFDCGEVLHVVAQIAAQILNEPVEQRGEVQRVAGGLPVVVGVWIGGGAVVKHLAVAVQGEREEHRRPVGLAVWCGVDLPGCVRADWAAAGARKCAGRTSYLAQRGAR
jgi:hypothetical protein